MCSAGSTESFAHLCLLQGILSHADKRVLAFSTAESVELINSHGPGLNRCLGASDESASDDQCGSEWFLLQLLPVVKRLCTSAKFKYHAFRLLELWIGRLKSVYQYSSQHFCLADECLASVESDLLELMAGHMDCCVDGVNELVGEVLDSVLQLDKVVHCHTSECYHLMYHFFRSSAKSLLPAASVFFSSLFVISKSSLAMP